MYNAKGLKTVADKCKNRGKNYMDDIVIRSRYPRHSVSGKKKKRYAGEKSGLNVIFARQIFLSLLILIAALSVKYVDAPMAKGLEEKIQYILAQDIDLNKLLETINNDLSKMWNKKLPDVNEDQTAKDTDQTDKITDSNSKSTGIIMMTVPVKGTLSSAFGERTDPFTGVKKMHEGIDIEAEKGESIKAALGGTVVEVRTSKSYGKFVKVKHKDDLTTVYAHCSLISVTEGQEVKQGEAIAKVGNTGASLGDHLHFEIWKSGKAINPLEYVSINKE